MEGWGGGGISITGKVVINQKYLSIHWFPSEMDLAEVKYIQILFNDKNGRKHRTRSGTSIGYSE